MFHGLITLVILGFCKLLKWIGLAFPIWEGGIITGAYSPRMTSQLISTAHEMPYL
jgi:hypothetical protein